MASNNDTRKKQKRTAIDGDVTVDEDFSSSSTHVHVILLSFGNVLQKFPNLLMQLLPYIADRTIFNSIASCNRDTHRQSKLIVPPWPKDYRLPGSNFRSIAVWSSDGTRVAYTGDRRRDIITDVITIIDQRHGIIHRIKNIGAYVSGLKFSPDRSFLVSASRDGTVKFWDNVDGNYEKLQEWNMREDFGEGALRIDISTCSKYIVMATNLANRVVLKRVENGETVRSLTPQPGMQYKTEVMFSVDCRAVYICDWKSTGVLIIKLWRPYLDNTDENSLTTLWEQSTSFPKIIVSHDKTMIAIQSRNKTDFNNNKNKGWLLSIDNNYSCTEQELNNRGVSYELLQFSPDDECIICATKTALKYLSVAENKFTGNTKYLLYTRNNLKVVNCSPNNRQIIVKGNNKVGAISLHIK